MILSHGESSIAIHASEGAEVFVMPIHKFQREGFFSFVQSP